MGQKRRRPEQIIHKLRQVEVALSNVGVRRPHIVPVYSDFKGSSSRQYASRWSPCPQEGIFNLHGGF